MAAVWSVANVFSAEREGESEHKPDCQGNIDGLESSLRPPRIYLPFPVCNLFILMMCTAALSTLRSFIQ